MGAVEGERDVLDRVGEMLAVGDVVVGFCGLERFIGFADFDEGFDAVG